MNRLYHLLYFVVLLGLGSCLDEIELKNQVIDEKAIVIQGKLVKGAPSLIEVSIQRIGDYDNSEIATFIGNAKVILVNGAGQTLELTELRNPQLYRASIPANDAKFVVNRGDRFQLKINLIDGRQYESALEVMPAVPEMRGIGYRLESLSLPDRRGKLQTGTYLRTWVSTPLSTSNPTARARLRWEIFANYKLTDDLSRLCYNVESIRPEKVLLYDGESATIDRLDTFLLSDVFRDHRFAEGMYLSVFQESLSEDAFTYWQQVKVLAERTGNMFEAPPAPITSNIRNVQNPQEQVYGYFYATAQDTLRLYIRPEAVGAPRKYCPQPRTERIGPTICDNCLLQTGSSLLKPTFWKD